MIKRLSIMLIDDNDIDLYLHEKFLKIKEIAHHTSTFNDVDDALSYLTEKDDAIFPDVILLDIQMPSLDGFDFIYRFEKIPKHHRENTHIIMVSSSLDFGDIVRAKANRHVLELLKKPLNVNDLIAVLKENKLL